MSGESANNIILNTHGMATDIDETTKARLLNAINAAFVLADLLDHTIDVSISNN